MGKENDVMMDYLEDNERFADFFNGILFQGKKVVCEEDLAEGSQVYKQAGDNKTTIRTRDVKKLLKTGGSLKVLAIENENQLDYSMPWRVMNYDSLEYGRQIKRISRENKEAGLLGSGAEYISGMREQDRLDPVFTVCLYHGQEPWKGPRCLKDMVDFGENKKIWEDIFSDYQMHIVCINEMTDFEIFSSSLKELFKVLSYRSDKKKLRQLVEENDVYHKLDIETAEVIGVMLGMDKKIFHAQGEDKVNMCEALRGLLEDSKAEGIECGIEKGIEKGIEQEREFIIKNMRKKGLSCAEIADLTGVALKIVQAI